MSLEEYKVSYQYNPFNFDVNSNSISNKPLIEEEKKVMINKNLSDITQIMHKNIDLVIERGSNLEILEKKAFNISSQSEVFHTNAKKLRRKMMCRYFKWICSIITILTVIILFILMLYYSS